MRPDQKGRQEVRAERSAATHSTVHANHGETAAQRDGLITDAQMCLKTPGHVMKVAPRTVERASARDGTATQVTLRSGVGVRNRRFAGSRRRIRVETEQRAGFGGAPGETGIEKSGGAPRAPALILVAMLS
ncbi:hypothetical protein TPB0596_03020 [Tsukamurella pulmonis]|nr:hypothetical protein TPB0596_03020 [Tsukamurella pulmonis]